MFVSSVVETDDCEGFVKIWGSRYVGGFALLLLAGAVGGGVGAAAQDAGIVRTWGAACCAPTGHGLAVVWGASAARGVLVAQGLAEAEEKSSPQRARRSAEETESASLRIGAASLRMDATGFGQEEVPRGTGEKITKYTLSPEREQKARALAKVRLRTLIVGTVYGLVVLLLILWKRWASAYRDVAEKASKRLWVQALLFAPLMALTMDVLLLPTGIYDNWIERRYGLSVQGWGSWFWDWTKGELLSVIFTFVVVWILYWVIRKWPKGWWFAFWLATLPLILLLVFLAPLVIDPMFHKFEPLQVKDPALAAQLVKMAQRAGENIPPQRMYWMGAGEKTTELNAYVTGFGASKRIVVWDTTIAKMNTPQIVFVTGHEMGHYVLHHIPKGIAFGAVGLFVLFYLGYRAIGWVLARWGPEWGIAGVGDLASYPALLLVISILGVLGQPIGNTFSRHLEHQADQYGLEVTHGLTADSGEVAAQSFNILGDVDLSDPEPSRLRVVLFYTHPSIPERIWYALHYDPWAGGGTGEFVK
jgi:STE24 endopeptidase